MNKQFKAGLTAALLVGLVSLPLAFAGPHMRIDAGGGSGAGATLVASAAGEVTAVRQQVSLTPTVSSYLQGHRGMGGPVRLIP